MQSSARSVTASHAVLPSEPRPRTEEELLEQEERRARAELRMAVSSLGDDALEAADLRRRVECHPFLSLGIGALSGFVLARPIVGVLGHVNARNLGSVMALLGRFGSLAGLASMLKDQVDFFQRRDRDGSG